MPEPEGRGKTYCFVIQIFSLFEAKVQFFNQLKQSISNKLNFQTYLKWNKKSIKMSRSWRNEFYDQCLVEKPFKRGEIHHVEISWGSSLPRLHNRFREDWNRPGKDLLHLVAIRTFCFWMNLFLRKVPNPLTPKERRIKEWDIWDTCQWLPNEYDFMDHECGDKNNIIKPRKYSAVPDTITYP